MTIKELFETLAEELKKGNGDRTASICFWNNGWETRDATEVTPDAFGVSIVSEEGFE